MRLIPSKIRLNGRAWGLAAALVTAAASPAATADWATIVMYHRFGESGTPSTNIRLEQFEAHIAEIARGPYSVLPLPEIVARIRDGRDLPDRALALTIDDAFLSVYREAWPRLREAGLPFTLFVATRPIDLGLAGYMNWDQIRELRSAGVTIGSQTETHPHMPDLSVAEAAAEIARSNRRFIAKLGWAPTLFAYPYGEFGAEIQRVVRDAGFAAAFGQHSGVAYAGMDRFALPRFAMNERYGDIGRFRLAANALPLRLTEVTPTDMVLKRNPPAFGFTAVDRTPSLARIACFASNQTGPVRIERLGAQRFEVRLDSPFPPGRGRINCTLPGADKRWHWYGTQFYVRKH